MFGIFQPVSNRRHSRQDVQSSQTTLAHPRAKDPDITTSNWKLITHGNVSVSELGQTIEVPATATVSRHRLACRPKSRIADEPPRPQNRELNARWLPADVHYRREAQSIHTCRIGPRLFLDMHTDRSTATLDASGSFLSSNNHTGIERGWTGHA